MRAKTWTLCFVALLLVSWTLSAAEIPVCGENDLVFGCTKTDEKGRLRAGCGVREGQRFFASEWWIYDLQTEKVLKQVAAGPEGIALVEIPNKPRWFILEGEMVCTPGPGSGEVSILYRFLVERAGKDRLLQHAYTPENLVATGNWNADTQLHYGEFKSRSLLGARRSASVSPDRP